MTLCSTLLVVEPFGRTRRGRVDRRGHCTSAANATRTHARLALKLFSFRLDHDSDVDPSPRLHTIHILDDVVTMSTVTLASAYIIHGRLNTNTTHTTHASCVPTIADLKSIQGYRTVLQVSRLELHARPSTRSYTTFLVRHLEIYNPSRSSGPTRTMTSALYL